MNTRVLICQGSEEEIVHLGSHGPTSSRLGSPVGAVSWVAEGLSHGGFEHLALCQPGCNPSCPHLLQWRHRFGGEKGTAFPLMKWQSIFLYALFPAMSWNW